MENLATEPDDFNETGWIYVHSRYSVHKFPFRTSDGVNPWAFVMHHAFLGWRAIRKGNDLILVPDEYHWGFA